MRCWPMPGDDGHTTTDVALDRPAVVVVAHPDDDAPRTGFGRTVWCSNYVGKARWPLAR